MYEKKSFFSVQHLSGIVNGNGPRILVDRVEDVHRMFVAKRENEGKCTLKDEPDIHRTKWIVACLSRDMILPDTRDILPVESQSTA